MRRRAFVCGSMAMLAAPLAAEAQQTGKVYWIGILETTSQTLNAANVEAFKLGLKELGYGEGRNLAIEYRSADGRAERFPDLASEPTPDDLPGQRIRGCRRAALVWSELPRSLSPRGRVRRQDPQGVRGGSDRKAIEMEVGMNTR